MKNHNKYAKLPQDLDLSFHKDLDLLPDTAADIDVNIDANTDVAALNLNVCTSLELDDEDNKDNEILFASGGVSGGGVGCEGSLGVAPLVTETSVASGQQNKRKQHSDQQLLAKRKICGLSSDSVIKVSLERSKPESTSSAIC